MERVELLREIQFLLWESDSKRISSTFFPLSVQFFYRSFFIFPSFFFLFVHCWSHNSINSFLAEWFYSILFNSIFRISIRNFIWFDLISSHLISSHLRTLTKFLSTDLSRILQIVLLNRRRSNLVSLVHSSATEMIRADCISVIRFLGNITYKNSIWNTSECIEGFIPSWRKF